jgi:hypothetical protein
MVGSLSSLPPFLERLERLLSSASAAADEVEDDEAEDEADAFARVTVGRAAFSGPNTVTLSVFLRCVHAKRKE